MDVKALFDRQFARVYRVALLYLGNPADAEDASQSVFLKYMEKPVAFADEEHEKAWCITVTKNLCRDMHRSFWRRSVTLGEVPEQPQPDEQQRVLTVLRRLPEKYREVLYMYYYEGYAVREIAAILSRKESTVQTQLADGRKKLRPMLIEEGIRYE